MAHKTKRNKFTKGINLFMEGTGTGNQNILKGAQASFDKIVTSSKATRMEKAVASFYSYHCTRVLREWKKAKYGNANPAQLSIYDAVSGSGWDDVDVACVVVGPNNYRFYELMAHLMGRTTEAVRFVHRYVHDTKPMSSWTTANNRYGRVKQARNVAKKVRV